MTPPVSKERGGCSGFGAVPVEARQEAIHFVFIPLWFGVSAPSRQRGYPAQRARLW